MPSLRSAVVLSSLAVLSCAVLWGGVTNPSFRLPAAFAAPVVQEKKVERITETSVPAAEVRRLLVKVKVGSIKVTAQSGLSEAKIKTTRTVSADTEDEAKRIADRTDVRITRGADLGIEDIVPDDVKTASGKNAQIQLKVEVSLPTGKTLDLGSNVGGINVTGQVAGITVATQTGGITLSGIDAPTVRATAQTGGVMFEGTAGQLTATTQTGGITVTGTIRETLTATAMTGGVTVALQETPAKSLVAEAKTGGVTASLPKTARIDVEMSTSTGGVHSTFPLTAAPRRIGQVGGQMQGTVNGGGTTVRLTSSVGGVTLNAK